MTSLMIQTVMTMIQRIHQLPKILLLHWLLLFFHWLLITKRLYLLLNLSLEFHCGQNTEAYIHQLEVENSALWKKNEAVGAHVVLAFDQVHALKHCLNDKVMKFKWRKLNVNAHWLSSAEGLALAEMQEREQQAQEELQQDAWDKK